MHEDPCGEAASPDAAPCAGDIVFAVFTDAPDVL